jgi:hypothetical protein
VERGYYKARMARILATNFTNLIQIRIKVFSVKGGGKWLDFEGDGGV